MSKSKVIQSKNIVISTQCFHRTGGIENIIQNLALEFTRKNYKVTIFADVSDATKGEVLDVCERLASLNQIFKNLYIEKHK